MPGNYSHTNRADGTTLTAAIYNSDHVNHINNATPQGIDDYSSTITEMRLMTDPGEVGTESLSTNLGGEIERLRYKIWELASLLHGSNLPQWYSSPTYQQPTPSTIDDYSANTTQMQANTDPGEVGSESLATNLAGELERLRFKIAELAKFLNDGVAVAQWYTTPSGKPLAQPKRNWIINGDFDIWQRNTSQTTAGYGSDDRWHNDHVGSSKTNSRQAFAIGQTEVPGNPKYYSQTAVTAGVGVGDYVRKSQRIEDVTALSGQTVTLSFYAKANAALSLSVEFVQFFGTGGTPSATVDAIGVTKVSLTTAWQKFTITATLPSVSGKTLGTNNDHYTEVRFWFDAGSDFNTNTNNLGHQTGNFDIARVKLEMGSVATEMEREPIEETLRKCQRYYEKSYALDVVPGSVSIDAGEQTFSDGTSTTHFEDSVRFSVSKRSASPTITIYSPHTGASGKLRNKNNSADYAASVPGKSESGFSVLVLPSPAVVMWGSYHYTADSEL